MGTVPLEVGRIACCHNVTHARHPPRDLDKVYLRADDYMQAGALDHRVGRADDRVPGFDSTDTQVAYSPSAQEAGWGVVVGLNVEEVEGTEWEDLLDIVDQPYLQEYPAVLWVIQKSGASLAVAVELYHQ